MTMYFMYFPHWGQNWFHVKSARQKENARIFTLLELLICQKFHVKSEWQKTLCNLEFFTRTHFSQTFREYNVFMKEVTSYLDIFVLSKLNLWNVNTSCKIFKWDWILPNWIFLREIEFLGAYWILQLDLFLIWRKTWIWMLNTYYAQFLKTMDNVLQGIWIYKSRGRHCLTPTKIIDLRSVLKRAYDFFPRLLQFCFFLFEKLKIS